MTVRRLHIGSVGELSDNDGIYKDLIIDSSDRRIALFRREGRYFALDETCPHRGGPLHGGEIKNGCVVCPWHFWQFDLETGVSPLNALSRVNAYTIEQEGEDLYLRIDDAT